jgi:hypothetical protein
MVKDLSPLFCECLLLLAWLRATRQAMQPDSPLCPPRLFYDRPWLLKKQATRQAKAMQRFPLMMPSFELSFACDVLPARVPLQAIRLE